MRASTLLNRVLNLEGATVTGVHPGSVVGDGPVVVRLRLRRRVMLCPSCSYRTRHRYDSRPVDSRWRHLDLGGRLCQLTMQRRRLRCPEHGVVTEAVAFARPGSRIHPGLRGPGRVAGHQGRQDHRGRASPASPGAPSARCASGSPPRSWTRPG